MNYIQCVIGFLLYTEENWPVRSRLVLTSFNHNHNTYGVLMSEGAPKFPDPASADEIYATRVQYKGPGTYVRFYCSGRYESELIESKIRRGLHPVSDRSMLQTSSDHNFGKNCLKAITSLSSDSAEKSSVKISHLLTENHCTQDEIASLAYRGKLDVHGKYKFFAPTELRGRVAIDADRPLEMKDIVLHGRFILTTESTRSQQALGWYQGDLHIFQRGLSSTMWFPLTSLDNTATNGVNIVPSLSKVKNLEPLFRKMTFDPLPNRLPSTQVSHRNSLHNNGYSSGDKTPQSVITTRFTLLSLFDAHGEIGQLKNMVQNRILPPEWGE
ncbi:unnamed protein product [Blumeria hordei]|uniref:Uncharacterized protein n=1 Tax=Blumeria hordei TaxID=2867405 RepID=A0A383UUL0_BLUHO|nr:unnamed protein product [Blumeria hordei]